MGVPFGPGSAWELAAQLEAEGDFETAMLVREAIGHAMDAEASARDALADELRGALVAARGAELRPGTWDWLTAPTNSPGPG